MAEDQQSSGDVNEQDAGNGSRQRLVMTEQEPGAVHLGGNVHGSDLSVPAGHTWAVQGDVHIGDGAALRIEDGATLQVGGHRQRGITMGDALRYLAGDDGGHQQRITLRAPAELEPGELERIKRYVLEAAPTEAEWQQIEQIKAAADRLPMGISPGELEQIKAAADRLPMGISPGEQQRLLAQFDGFAGTSIQRTIQESQAARAETLKAVTAAAIEPAVMSVSDIFRSAAIEQVADLSAQMRSILDMPLSGVARVLSDFGEVARGQSDVYAQMTAALRGLEDAARWQRKPDVLASVLGEYRIGGAGVPAVVRRQPEPQRVQVVHMADEVLLAELDRRLREGAISPTAARSMARLLQAHTGKGKPGPQEPPLETKVKLIEDYERLRDKKGITQSIYVEHYAHKICPVSLRTFQSYAKDVRLWRESHGATE